MAYKVVAQTEYELPSDDDDSRNPSPRLHADAGSFEQLPLDTDNLGSGGHLQHAEVEEHNGIRSLGSMVRSITAASASYDSVDEDDWSDGAAPDRLTIASPHRTPAPFEDDCAELQTPTTERSVPLSHPTPGLQSLQGAYVQNVERLEKSAERLSLSSADIGSEIRRMDLEQRGNHFSKDHPDSETRSGQLSEQHALGQIHESSSTHPLAHGFLPPPPNPAPSTAVNANQHSHYPPVSEVKMDRPSSAASGDTYRQARILFNDFDGVHYVPIDKGLDLARKLSLNKPPLAGHPDNYQQPQEGENMVLYPAPVPVMLNLPPKLSHRRKEERENRCAQLLDAVAPEQGKSAPWLAEQEQTTDSDQQRTQQLSDLPSHLRASVSVEAPSTMLDFDPAQRSAVATLDSILEASTKAPVTAFTDHPFAGSVGQEVYGSSKRGKFSKDASGQRKSPRPKNALNLAPQLSLPDFRDLYSATEAQAAETHETTSLRRRDCQSEYEKEDDSEASKNSEDDTDEDDEELRFTGPPATLIAELEQRKHDLKQRRRTAANTVGLHSTLLQLDAVAAKQSEHRRQKRVALAWETPENHPTVEDDDEDVPLAMLFPDKAQGTDEIRPLGLMERREMDEGEPLSRRRARLKGEPLPQNPNQRPMTMYSQGLRGPRAQDTEQDSGEEGETLGQRLRRLKGHGRNVSKADTDFATEILVEFDHLKEDENKEEQSEAPQEDETLGQRRARLRKEATEKRNSGLKIPRYRRSMADVLHAPRPSTAGQQSMLQRGQDPANPSHQLSFDNQMPMQQLPVQSEPPKTAAGLSQYQAPSLPDPYGYLKVHPNALYSDAILGNRNLSYAIPPSIQSHSMQQAIDPGQRAAIDRWRQSIA